MLPPTTQVTSVSRHHKTLDNIPFEIQYLVPDRWYPSLCSVAVVDTFDTSLPV